MDFFTTTVTDEAKGYVAKVLDSGFLSEGKVVAEFEHQLSEQLGLRNPVCVNSGTSALHLALLHAGVKEGDEVILPAQTFVATGLAVLYCGATPVFADIDPFTGNITPESIGAKLTDRTSAIIVVHWGGYPADLFEINKLLYDKEITLIEDAAHALGAEYRAEPIGGWMSEYSDYCCFSLQAIKGLTSGDGGIICPIDGDYVEGLKKKRWFGISREFDDPDELGERQYRLREIGYKYHLNDYSAALGLGNLFDFSDRVVERRLIADDYFDGLENVAGVTLMNYKPDRESSYWLFPIRVEKRLEFVRALKDKGIPTSVVHQRIDKHPIFGAGIREDLAGQKEFNEEQIHIPIHPDLTDEDVSHVINTIKAGW